MFNRKAYHKQYYLTKLKPFRKKGKPEDIYQCAFCGFYSRLNRLKSTTIYNGIYIRAGCIHNKPETLPDNIKYLLYEKQRELFTSVAYKTLRFLKICIKYDLITKEEISKLLDIKLINYGSSKFGYPASNFYDPLMVSKSNTYSYSTNNSAKTNNSFSCSNSNKTNYTGGINYG